MSEACDTIRGPWQRHVVRSLKAFRAQYEEHNYVYNAAMMRVPDEWREKFHEEALKSKRGQPRQHRSAPATTQGEKVGELWNGGLAAPQAGFQGTGQHGGDGLQEAPDGRPEARGEEVLRGQPAACARGHGHRHE